MLVSDSFFTLLGSRAYMGRTPTAADVGIVAVMPPDFDFPHNVDFWYPARPEDMNRNATIRVYSAIGRLRAGHTLT